MYSLAHRNVCGGAAELLQAAKLKRWLLSALAKCVSQRPALGMAHVELM